MIDLIDVNGRLKSWDEISKDFNIGPIEFLEWYGLIQSIPSIWKESILAIQSIRRFITVFQEMVKR